jgi:hypothetical protein
MRSSRRRRTPVIGVAGPPSRPGHVAIVPAGVPTVVATAALRTDWDDKQLVLAAWKARRLLLEARAHLCAAAGSPAAAGTPALADLEKALDATVVGIDALQPLTARHDGG